VTLAVLAGRALTAPAAAHQPLVGNFDQGASLAVDDGPSDVAQGFTTGSNPNGYHLLGVQLQFLNLVTGMTAKVATGLPGSITEVATLTAAATHGGGGYVNFIAHANTQLASDTTYWVVIEGSSGQMLGTSSGAEDTGSAVGWSIANNRLVRISGTTGPFSEISSAHSGPIRMRVFGHVNTATATSDEFHIRRATGNRPTKSIGLSASLNGNGLPAVSWTAPAAVATHCAPQGYRLRRSTDSGAYSGILIDGTGITS